jgi:resuscitation-promoting factor RpfB
MLNRYGYRISLALMIVGVVFITLSLMVGPPQEQAVGPARILVATYTHDSMTTITSREKLPANLLAEAGIMLFPGDQLVANGQPIEHDIPLSGSIPSLIQIQQAIPVTIIGQSGHTTVYRPASPVGKLLWKQGLRLTSADDISSPPIALTSPGSTLSLRQAVSIVVKSVGRDNYSYSAAATTGQALAASGFPLQGLNSVDPSEDQPLPENGVLQLVTRHETVAQIESTIPYTTERQADSSLLENSETIIQGGQDGRVNTRIRTLFVDGVEVEQYVERQFVLNEPQTEIVAYGTHSATVISQPAGTSGEGAPSEYWASKKMFATSYYPCGFVNRCSYVTASGQTLQKGIVAVTSEWYSELAGYQVYIPGYGIGVIADTGGGIPGKDWIDLGYSNEDYVPWSGMVDVYFLPPAPQSIPWFLQ